MQVCAHWTDCWVRLATWVWAVSRDYRKGVIIDALGATPDLSVKQAGHHTTALTDTQRSISWRESEVLQAGFMTQLREFADGGTVCLLAANQASYPLAILAAVYAGWTIVPVNNRLTDEELRYIVEDSGADLIWTDAQYCSTAQRIAGDRHILRLDSMLSETGIAEPDIVEADISKPDIAELRERLASRLQQPAGSIMLYTSGTTGRPKGVLRKHGGDVASLLQRWRDMAAALKLDTPGPHLVSGPLYHAAPLLFALFAFKCGNPLLIMPRFDAERCLQWLQQYQVAHGHWVPTMFVRMLALRDRYPQKPAALRQVLHGAAPIAPAVKRQMLDWWGPVLTEYWGGSESGTVTRCGSEEWLAHPGTVGRAVPGFEVRAVDESGRTLAAGEVGRLAIRHTSGEPVFHYHREPDKTRRAYIDAASFVLGDIGYVDADGWVYLKDRDSRIVISGGVNLYPAEVEAVLIVMPEVLDVAVIGVPDEEWGESLAALVELAADVDEQGARARIESHLAEQLAGYKHPKYWRFQALNRPDNGKLSLPALRRAFE